jgi:hypothetical protein
VRIGPRDDSRQSDVACRRREMRNETTREGVLSPARLPACRVTIRTLQFARA